MTLPPIATMLRHRPPALLLARVETFDGGSLACAAGGRASWRWPDVLEAAAQCAGLLAGLQPGGPGDRAVIAEYREVRVHAPTHDGPLAVHARLDRRVLRFWRCRVEARAADGRLLLDGTVTVASDAA